MLWRFRRPPSQFSAGPRPPRCSAPALLHAQLGEPTPGLEMPVTPFELRRLPVAPPLRVFAAAARAALAQADTDRGGLGMAAEDGDAAASGGDGGDPKGAPAGRRGRRGKGHGRAVSETVVAVGPSPAAKAAAAGQPPVVAYIFPASGGAGLARTVARILIAHARGGAWSLQSSSRRDKADRSSSGGGGGGGGGRSRARVGAGHPQ